MSTGLSGVNSCMALTARVNGLNAKGHCMYGAFLSCENRVIDFLPRVEAVEQRQVSSNHIVDVE